MVYGKRGILGIVGNAKSVTYRKGVAICGSNPTLTASLKSITYGH